MYYGGPVISSVKVYSVFWGPKVDPTVTAKIGSFFSATVDSTYMDWLKEYDTSIKAVDGRQGTNQTIGRGTYAGEYTITPKNVARRSRTRIFKRSSTRRSLRALFRHRITTPCS